ncbi:30S ribosomal protein S1 [Deltaproteobacteria bacterium PRO3]|nr:30S ribosomal protein S1 [Deltaproteobacteria bacterium PRO3]
MQNQIEDFGALFEESLKKHPLNEGELVKGTVVKVTRDYVMVDIGFKSEGQINIDEFRNLDGEVTVQPGDKVDVVFEAAEDESGMVVLSKEKADALQAWDKLAEVEKENGIIEGVIINKIKGGMVVNVGGVRAFLPGSQIDLKPVKSLDRLIGKKFRFKILKLNKAKGNVVLSRRAILELEREVQKAELLKNIAEGQVVEGQVKNITDYGAFIDLGGIDGLLHITDMTWGRINHPSEVVALGQTLKVVVLKFDQDSHKVSLGLKQLLPDPWESVPEKYTVGTRLKGKVVNVTDYGAFVELEEGVEGLVHVSEMSWLKKVKHPSKIVNVGDFIEAVVLDFDSNSRRISLGMKQIEPNPWSQLQQKYPLGSRVKGVVKNVTDFGVFIGIEEGIDGLVHVSDFSWAHKAKHPSEIYQKGQEVEAVVLNIDQENERFSLGVKQLDEDPFQKIIRGFAPGSHVKGKVTAVENHGVSLDMGDEVQGFIPNKELDGESPAVGDEIEAQVTNIDDKEHRVVLSIRAYHKSTEKQALEDFRAKQGDATATLSDVLSKN